MRNSTIVCTTAVLVLELACLAPPARSTEVDLRPLVTASLEVYNELAEDPLPFLTSQQVDALLAGEVVRNRRRRTPGEDAESTPERVTGYIVIHQPRTHVWLASLDPAFQASPMLTEARLEMDDVGGSRWYQHVDLPWPLTDRHWVIDLGKRIDLTASTQGLIWEQHWRLAPDGPAIAERTVADGRAPGLTPESIRDAIYLPANEGAWILFAITEDVTFLVYRVATVVGGGIPDSWIATFAMAQLEGLLRKVATHSEEAWKFYDPERTPMFGGDGRIIGALPRR